MESSDSVEGVSPICGTKHLPSGESGYNVLRRYPSGNQLLRACHLPGFGFHTDGQFSGWLTTAFGELFCFRVCLHGRLLTEQKLLSRDSLPDKHTLFSLLSLNLAKVFITKQQDNAIK